MALKGQFLSTDEIPADEQNAAPTSKSRERDEFQQARDADVGALKTTWTAAGSPDLAMLRTQAGFQAATKKRYVVVKDDVAAVKDAIRRACTLHKVSPVYAPNVTLADGTVAVKYTVGPPVVHVPRGNANPNGVIPPHDETAGDQENPADDTAQNQRGKFRR